MQAPILNFKYIIWASSLSLAVLLSPLTSLALTVQEVPNPRQTYGGWVTDMADILKPDTENQINQMIEQLEAKNGAEIAVVTVRETSPAASPKEFTTKLFNYWKIGKKGKDNGVLFLISVKDRRVEIETGYGVSRILPDANVGNIIDTQIIPKFKQKDFDGGALAGMRAIVVILESPTSQLINIILGLVGIIFWGLLFQMIRSGVFFQCGGSGSGGSGSGDSGSFGGGSSGGGGAGGSW